MAVKVGVQVGVGDGVSVGVWVGGEVGVRVAVNVGGSVAVRLATGDNSRVLICSARAGWVGRVSTRPKPRIRIKAASSTEPLCSCSQARKAVNFINFSSAQPDFSAQLAVRYQGWTDRIDLPE